MLSPERGGRIIQNAVYSGIIASIGAIGFAHFLDNVYEESEKCAAVIARNPYDDCVDRLVSVLPEQTKVVYLSSSDTYQIEDGNALPYFLDREELVDNNRNRKYSELYFAVLSLGCAAGAIISLVASSPSLKPNLKV